MTFGVMGPAAARRAAGLPSADMDVDMGDGQQASFFFDAIFCDHVGAIELRCLGDRPHQEWFSTEFERDRAAWRAQQLCGELDVYVGIVPRAETRGGRDALVPESRWCWAECDTPMSVSRAMNMGVQPRLVVRSSPGKAHCYWPLRSPLSLDLLERANRRLAEHLGADPRATDAARILRVPGTVNHKYDPPPRVSITHVSWDRNPLPSELVGDLRDPEPARPLPVRRPKRDFGPDPVMDDLRAVPSREYIYAISGREVLRGMVTCPWHGGGNERTPSLHVGGPQETLFHCFGCDEGGDIVTFAARYWDLDERRDFQTIKARLVETLR